MFCGFSSLFIYLFKQSGLTALDVATMQGKIPIVEALVDKLEREGELKELINGKLLIVPSDSSSFPLKNQTQGAMSWACSSGSSGVVALFLQNGVSANVVDREGGSCLSRAAVRGHFETAKLLLEHGYSSSFFVVVCFVCLFLFFFFFFSCFKNRSGSKFS